MNAENPFVFDRPLDHSVALIGRDDELGELLAKMRAGGEIRVEGPYRHGKTSLINVALAALPGDGGFGVRIDCSGVLTADDVVRRLEDAYARAWADRPAEEVLIERLEALPFRLAASVDVTPEGRIEALLAVVGEVAERTSGPAVICLDEFQDALAVSAVVDAIEKARAHDGRRVGYVFAGPDRSSHELGVLRDDAPTITVATIEPTLFADEIIKRFSRTGREAGEAAKIIATVGAGHPQRTNLLASELWELTGDGERATVATARAAIDRALLRSTPEFEIRWQGLHGNERRVAVAIANEIAPQGTRAQRATGLAGYGAAQRAVQGVKASGVAEIRNERMTLTDPLFAEWLRHRHAAAPPEPDWSARRREAARHVARGIGR